MNTKAKLTKTQKQNTVLKAAGVAGVAGVAGAAAVAAALAAYSNNTPAAHQDANTPSPQSSTQQRNGLSYDLYDNYADDVWCL